MAGPIISKVRVERLTRILREFPSESLNELNPWLDKQVRSLISSSGKVPGLVQVTPPHMAGIRGIAAKKIGENAVNRDVWKVYATPGKVYEMLAKIDKGIAARFWALHKQSPREALGWLQNSAPLSIRQMAMGFDGGTAHEKNRRKNGRVTLRTPKVIVMKGLAQVRKYIRKKQRNVGLLASSIPAAAGNRFGKLSGVPGWVSRHKSRYGYVKDRKKRGRRLVTIGLSNSAIQDMQRRFNYVLRYRIDAMKREIPYVARALEKKLRARLK